MTLRIRSKQILAGVAAVGILTVGGGATAFAQTAGAGSGGTASVAATPGAHRGAFRVAVRTAFVAAADALGTTPQDLRAQLRSGPQSIAQVAGDRVDAVEAAIRDAIGPKIDEAQSQGLITQERADRMHARVGDFATKFVNHLPRAGGQS